MAKVKRRLIQIGSAVITNAYIKGFLSKTIYKGGIKRFCVPGLNCYSCPGALGSCPIGAFQAVSTSIWYRFSFYVMGFLFLIGTFVGRMVCGWVCPFGFFQELLYKIPSIKIRIPKFLNCLKYLILMVFVIILPITLLNEAGVGTPYFCKLICPAGTLEAGIPMVLGNEDIRNNIGWLFYWKLSLLILVILWAITSKRPFCRVLCPLGAIYSLFNKVSFYQIHIDSNKCTKCNACQRICPVDHKIYEAPNGLECIRCNECVEKCPQTAIYSGFKKHTG